MNAPNVIFCILLIGVIVLSSKSLIGLVVTMRSIGVLSTIFGAVALAHGSLLGLLGIGCGIYILYAARPNGKLGRR